MRKWINRQVVMNSKARKVYPYLPLFVGVLILFLPSLVTGKVIFWGTPALQFVPWMYSAFLDIQSGSLPLWNPLNGMGAPLLANYQLAFFYPLNWFLYPLFLLKGAQGVAWGYTFLLMVHLLWAGMGMIRLVKTLKVGWLGQAVSGIAFGLGGYLAARAGFISIIWSAAWFPWMVAAVNQLIQSGVVRRDKKGFGWLDWSVLVLCILMQLLAGHAQLSWYSLLFIAGWACFLGWQEEGLQGATRSFLLFCSAGLTAAALAAIQLLPTMEYLLQSQRASAVDFENALTYSFWGWRFLTFFAPDLFGNPGMGDYWGYASFWEDAVYFGLLPFLLAVSTLNIFFNKNRSVTRRNRKWLVSYLWVWIVVGLIFALGKNTPILPFLYHHVPTFAMFNAPTRYMIWAVFAFAILAGVGVEGWKTPTGRGLYVLRLATAGSFAVSLGAFLAWGFLRDIDATFIRATALAGMWGVGAGLLTLFQARIPAERLADEVGEDEEYPASADLVEVGWKQSLWYLLAAGWLVADLVVAGWHLIPTIDGSFYKNPASVNFPDHRLFIPSEDEYELKFKQFFLFTDYSNPGNWDDLREVMLPNLNLLNGVAFVNNFDPLLPARFVVWYDYLNQLGEAERIPYLQMMDVGWVKTFDPAEKNGIQISEVESPSRIGWYACARFVPNEKEAWQEMSTGAPSFTHLTVEAAPGAVIENACPPVKGEADWDILSAASNRVVIQVTAEETGWLMLADSWYPGWKVRVDEELFPLYHANYLFKAVQVPAGSHLVEFYYHPASFYIGAVISLMGLVSFCSILVLIYASGRKLKSPA